MLYVNIKKSFKDFSLDIEFETNKETLALFGPSGCGKSMTLKCIAGIEKPDEGEIILNNRILFSSKKKINLSPQKRKVGLLFQNYALFPNMTLEENIKIGIPKNHPNKDEIVKEKIKAFSLEGLEKNYPHELSGGQQQRTALARMLVNEPDLIMLDEPFSALDDHLKWQMEQEVISLLNKHKTSTIFVSHNIDEVYRISDKVAVLQAGKIISLDKKEEIFNNPKNLHTARLAGCSNISRAKKISEGKIYAIDWDMELLSSKPIDNKIKYIGIYGNNIEICPDTSSNNTYEVEIIERYENAFTYTLVLGKVTGKSNLYLEIDKKDFHKYELDGRKNLNIKLREEKLLLLH